MVPVVWREGAAVVCRGGHGPAIAVQRGQQPLLVVRVFDAQGPGLAALVVAQGGVFAGVDQRVFNAVAAQGGPGHIGGMALGNAVAGEGHAGLAQGDAPGIHVHMLPAHALAGGPDFCRGGQAAFAPGLVVQGPQRLHAHVKPARAACRHGLRHAQHRQQIGAGLVQVALAVQSSKLALRAVQAHGGFHPANGGHGGIQRQLGLLGAGVGRPQRQRGAQAQQAALPPLQGWRGAGG